MPCEQWAGAVPRGGGGGGGGGGHNPLSFYFYYFYFYFFIYHLQFYTRSSDGLDPQTS